MQEVRKKYASYLTTNLQNNHTTLIISNIVIKTFFILFLLHF